MPIIRKLRELERGALADVWRSTLADVPSLFGRLVYLNSLRSADTGSYVHHGLAGRYGEDAAGRALMQSHEETFAAWIASSLEQQKADLDLYISGLQYPRTMVVETWLRNSPHIYVVPLSARKSERELFGLDFEMLLELLRREYRLLRPDPEDA